MKEEEQIRQRLEWIKKQQNPENMRYAIQALEWVLR